jgi:hypothetical protein
MKNIKCITATFRPTSYDVPCHWLCRLTRHIMSEIQKRNSNSNVMSVARNNFSRNIRHPKSGQIAAVCPSLLVSHDFCNQLRCNIKKNKFGDLYSAYPSPFRVVLGAESRVCYPGNTADRKSQRGALTYYHLSQSRANQNGK